MARLWWGVNKASNSSGTLYNLLHPGIWDGTKSVRLVLLLVQKRRPD